MRRRHHAAVALAITLLLTSTVASARQRGSPASAAETKLWIGYTISENMDIAAAARVEEAKARTQRTIALAACAATPEFADCPRQAEITFRGYLLAIQGVRFRLYAGENPQWLVEVREEALNPHWALSHLDGRRVFPLGMHVDEIACRLVRDTPGAGIRPEEGVSKELVDVLCDLIRWIANADTRLGRLAHQTRSWNYEERQMVAVLLARGGSPQATQCCSGWVLPGPGNPIQFFSRSLLDKAIETQDFGLVRLLLEKGANANSSGGEFRRTPLIAAASLGLTDIVRALLDAGADVTAKDELGETALQKAEDGGHAATIALLRLR